jgi:NADH:ubiquinone oxidoreductase subunit 4 (subunit M)
MEIDNQQHKETKMISPQVKATIALPFATALLTAFIVLLGTYPQFFTGLVIIIATIGLLGSIWYALFSLFGGED